MRDDTHVRTTLDIDEDILQAAKEIAVQEKTTAGKVLSNLARRALTPVTDMPVRHGVPLLPPRPGEGVVTVEEVNSLRDQD